jgi:hypothetical protein
MFHLATEQSVLAPLERNIARMRASFYADDAAIFIRPEAADVNAIQQILKFFVMLRGCGPTTIILARK